MAKPLGALGRLEELAVWLAGVQGTAHPRPPAEVAVVVFAGDHGVTTGTSPVSAYPRQVTALMVREFLRGGAAVTVLARAHGARVRVLDLGVDDDLAEVPAEVVEHKVRRGSGAIDREDALTADQVEAALAAGRVADEEIDAGADLLVPGDMGIGNTTVAATLVGALLGLLPRTWSAVAPASTTRPWTPSGPWSTPPSSGPHRIATTRSALLRVAGSADLAAGDRLPGPSVRAGDAGAAGRGGLRDLRPARRTSGPGSSAWWCAGHRSTEPAHRLALEALGLCPILDLELRLGEGSGALTALPVLRTAPLLLDGMATLAEVTG